MMKSMKLLDSHCIKKRLNLIRFYISHNVIYFSSCFKQSVLFLFLILAFLKKIKFISKFQVFISTRKFEEAFTTCACKIKYL